jgi:hypothetical protein
VLSAAYLSCCAAEVERFLQETEEYINKLTKKLVQYKAEEQAGEAVQEAITEVGQRSTG